jgi:hypothetical protein
VLFFLFLFLFVLGVGVLAYVAGARVRVLVGAKLARACNKLSTRCAFSRPFIAPLDAPFNTP